MLSDIRRTVKNVVNVKLTNRLHANRHCESMFKEPITGVEYGEALTSMVNIQDPVTHGWKVGDDGSIEIDWMDCQPAPDEVFLNQNVSQCK